MMLEDYFTKPLKGKVFKLIRDVIMGYKPIPQLKSIPVSTKERAVNNRKKLYFFKIKRVMWNFWITKYYPKTKRRKNT